VPSMERSRVMECLISLRYWALRALLVGIFNSGAIVATQAGQFSTDWSVGHRSKARLIFGALPDAASGQRLVAGLEIVMEKGWKTYWRSPGDSGGIPPHFDWSKSRNLQQPRVLFPGPKRIVDKTGTTIGYKKRVVFPIELEAGNPGRPVGVAVRVDYGVCREICVPARALLAVEIQSGQLRSLPSELAVAFAKVPHKQASLARVPLIGSSGLHQLPSLRSMITELTGASPRITFDIAFPSGVKGADLFVEGRGVFLPMTRAAGRRGDNIIHYEIDLSEVAERGSLKGKSVRLTMVSGAGNSEVDVILK